MSLDERQRVVKRTFTKAQLEGMSIKELVALVGEAGPDVQFHGTGVVRKADGSIRYDAGATPGDYHESDADLAKTADTTLELVETKPEFDELVVEELDIDGGSA